MTKTRRNFKLFIVVILASMLCTCSALGKEELSELTLRLNKLPKQMGTKIYLALFDKAQAFPSSCTYAALAKTLTLDSEDSMQLKVQIRPGVYALSAFIDENNNGTLDRGLFGIPKEPCAFSNNIYHRTKPTTYGEAAFAVPLRGGSVNIDGFHRYN